jgi:DNA-binding NarL/FixJ family response regulator
MKNLPAPCRVLIVDDAPAVREALRWALEAESDFVVVGEAGDGIEALQRAAELTPDVVILDIELPLQDGYAVSLALKARPDAPLVLFLTVHSDAEARQRSIEAGGDGFVEKGAGWPALITLIRHTLLVNTPQTGTRGHQQKEQEE